MKHREDAIFVGFAAAYLVGFFLTFGAVWHRQPECGTADDNSTVAHDRDVGNCHFANGVTIFVGAAAWPIYWAGRTAIWVTE